MWFRPVGVEESLRRGWERCPRALSEDVSCTPDSIRAPRVTDLREQICIREAASRQAAGRALLVNGYFYPFAMAC